MTLVKGPVFLCMLHETDMLLGAAPRVLSKVAEAELHMRTEEVEQRATMKAAVGAHINLVLHILVNSVPHILAKVVVPRVLLKNGHCTSAAFVI